MLLCINTGKLRTDANRMRDGSDQFYVRPPEEMYALFPGHEEAVAAQPGDRRQRRHRARLQEAALPRLHAAGQENAGRLPARAVRGGPEGALRRRPRRAARRRRERLEHELGIICRMGFASYFLIVWDFVRFALEQGHPGQGPRLGVRGARQLRPAS